MFIKLLILCAIILPPNVISQNANTTGTEELTDQTNATQSLGPTFTANATETTTANSTDSTAAPGGHSFKLISDSYSILFFFITAYFSLNFLIE